MIPSIARNGTSFRGAGAYYLHDKAEEGRPKPSTTSRVAWTATRNLVNEDPQKAIDEMWHTAEDAAHLKAMSGRAQQGRKNDTPVKPLSLSWAPHQTPTRKEMEAAADSFLEAMGWQEHQALYIAHSDEPHPHLHVVLNRVHPETGLTLNDWQERKRAQKWALAYEREQGQILCLARVGKYEQHRDLEPNGMPYPYARLNGEQERAFDHPLAEAAVLDRLEKDLLAERHGHERQDFLASGKGEFRQVRQAAYRDVRDEFKPPWREHYREHKEAHEHLDRDTRTIHRDAARLAREGDHEGATQLLADLDEQRAATLGGLAADRRELRQHQLEATRGRQDEACRLLIEQRALDFQDIKDRQKLERAEFKDLQALREAGQPYDVARMRELLGQDSAPAIANDNQADLQLTEPANQSRLLDQEHDPEQPNPFAHQVSEFIAPPTAADAHGKAPHRDASDLGAGGIGAIIEVGLRVLEGFISPPSREDQARAKARAIREEQEAPARAAALDERTSRNDFMRYASAAVRDAELERERDRKLYLDDRGRSRYRER